MPRLYHGTLVSRLSNILANGISKGEGWGGAWTSGVFLSGTEEGALYWAKLAFQREAEEKLEIDRFDRAHGGDVDQLLAVLVIDIPKDETDKLKADEEQFEDVGADFDPDDWEQSLDVIGDVRFEREIPPQWIGKVIRPSDVKIGRRR